MYRAIKRKLRAGLDYFNVLTAEQTLDFIWEHSPKTYDVLLLGYEREGGEKLREKGLSPFMISALQRRSEVRQQFGKETQGLEGRVNS